MVSLENVLYLADKLQVSQMFRIGLVVAVITTPPIISVLEKKFGIA